MRRARGPQSPGLGARGEETGVFGEREERDGMAAVHAWEISRQGGREGSNRQLGGISGIPFVILVSFKTRLNSKLVVKWVFFWKGPQGCQSQPQAEPYVVSCVCVCMHTRVHT